MLPAYGQRKGTLSPGQTISVNNYTVQVERYLSQGGFAHVYLVRTPTPVYNTTHHVLKRIAVADEAMLTEVKKEVDVMRLLKGHPNIVHFIDASWHKLPNGSFEVFILMEYCPGGGIIDMMNRRLRERLTEAEILQIFVDVCEGVAHMHNTRPPLLHRDLKVENILQASPAAFKLCDFGSATTISNTPSNMQEIRALEADLNKHTTLQYRAPEMVDVYSKRPINEKSDVWALGVLLYKLCYYTTPFEEHGPLAILNVQYRTPAYPSYSQDMHMLIGSMLREHGAQRPTVFELLAHVHRLRGTKSKFSYTIPLVQPLLPRVPQTMAPNNSPGLPMSHGTSTKPAISLYNPGTDAHLLISNQGIQAREKVLEAIAPMRRGRPTHPKEGSSRQASPQKLQQATTSSNWLDNAFGTEENQAWKAAKDKVKIPPKEDAWVLVSPQTTKADTSRSAGFGDNFAEKLWTTSNPNSVKAGPQPTATPITTSVTNETSAIPTPLAFTGSRMLRPKQERIVPNKDKARDAFDGLGLMAPSLKPAPTLGEARKLRTGLAVTSNYNPLSLQGDYLRTSIDKPVSSSPRPTPSPRQNYLSPTSNQLPSFSPGSSHSTFSASAGTTPFRPTITSGPSPSGITDGLPIESTFPSVEELDARIGSSANSFYSFVINDNSKKFAPQFKSTDARPLQFKPKITNKIGSSDTGEHNSKINAFSNATYNPSTVKSEQVGTAPSKNTPERSRQDYNTPGSAKSIQSSPLVSQRRPSLIRRHRSSVSMKPSALLSAATDEMEETSLETAAKIPLYPLSDTPPRDWLTGDDLSKPSRPVPVLRESPSKRASFISQSNLIIPESSSAQHFSVTDRQEDEPSSADLSPTVSRFKRAFPDVENVNVQQGNSNLSSSLIAGRSATRTETEPDSSSSDEGPEEVGAIRSKSHTMKTPAFGAKERQGSVHDLVNQYGGGLLLKEREIESDRLIAQVSQTGDSVPQKSPAAGLTAPVKQGLERKTSSPTNLSVSPGIASKSTHRPQASISTPKTPAPPSVKPPSSAGSRSRPQSMFIFPSKSDHSNTIPTPTIDTANLMPPEDPRPRPPRRLSISDMVQKYEAISGKGASPLPPGPPSPVRPMSSKVTPSPTNGQSEKVAAAYQASGDELSASSSTRPTASTSHDIYKHHTNNGEPASKQGKPLNRRVSDKRKPSLATRENISSPRRLSIKAAPTIITSSNRADPLAVARAAKSAAPRRDSLNASQISRSPRKRTLSIPSNPLSKPKDESHSPVDNEAYQGVSKLIDQWQKKSAEVEQSRPLPSKRSFSTKRVGIAPTSNS